MFGREMRGKLPEARRQTEHPDEASVRKRDREQKEKMKKYADKRRHTAAMRIRVGETVLCKQEQKNSLTPLFDPVPMVVIGIKGDMITAKKQPENSDQELRGLEATKRRVQALCYV